MDILKDIIYIQNKDLLTRMAEDLYIDEGDEGIEEVPIREIIDRVKGSYIVVK